MRTQDDPSRMAEPPPRAVRIERRGHQIGWLDGTRVGFQGFGNETDALRAAWVAHCVVTQRPGRPPDVPRLVVDFEALSLHRGRVRSLVLAGGRAIAAILPPRAPGEIGAAFAFEIAVPPPNDDVAMRDAAALIYQALRRIGVPWAVPSPSAGHHGPQRRTMARLAGVGRVAARWLRGVLFPGASAAILVLAAVASRGALARSEADVPLTVLAAAGFGAAMVARVHRRRHGPPIFPSSAAWPGGCGRRRRRDRPHPPRSPATVRARIEDHAPRCS